MRIKNIQDAEAALQKFIPAVSAFSGDNMTLNRMWPLLEAVGNPQEKLKIIHVAGTSGKTSTSYYIASILNSTGKKVGLTVSPHIDSITERFQINQKPISEKLFAEELSTFLDLISDVSDNASYFEILIVFAYWVFDRQGVDYAVIETGMGGLLDGTNVSSRKDKICVITNIGIDHTKILGDTIPEIASQKAGIIQENNEVVMYEQSDEIMQEIQKRATEKSAKLHLVKSHPIPLIANKLQLEVLPLFQQINWLLAEYVSQIVSNRDNFELKPLNPQKVYVPARMDVLDMQNGNILVMDGAHNRQKMEMFTKSFMEKYPNTKADILLSLKEGKEYKEVVNALTPITRNMILTTFNTSQDMPAKSQDPNIIKKYCNDLNLKSEIIVDSQAATKKLLNLEGKMKIITGSFYLLGQVRKDLI